MAAAPPLGRLFSEVTCSICLDFFQEPVTLECEHNFCRLCISRSWEQGEAFYSCPECRKVFRERRLKPNRLLANIVEGVKELKPEPRWGNPTFYCQRHEEKHKLFCLGCQGLLCVVCSCSSEHRGHRVIPIEEASVLYREKLEKAKDFLHAQREQAGQCQSQQEAKISKIKEEGELLKEQVKADLASIYQFLDKKKQELEAKIDEEVCKTVRPLQEDLVKVCQGASRIEQAYQDMQVQLSFKEPQELLQDIKQLLDRCKQNQITPADVPTDLHIDSIITPFRYVKIWDEIKTLVPARESLKLDARTAHPRLILTENFCSVVDGGSRRECTLGPQRFDHWLCVLATSSFQSGRHYWDVELGGNNSCVLGVASESANRLVTGPLMPQEGYWVLELTRGSLVNLDGPGARSLPLRHQPRAIRVYLDYEEGQLSFYDADSLCHLYTLRDRFTQKLFPLFNPHNKKEGSCEPLRLRNHVPCYNESKSNNSPIPESDVEMANLDVLKSMQDEAICPICLEYFAEPVTVDCGHNFCRACILGHWGSNRGPASCPQCRAQLPQKTLRPNRFVSNIVENVMKLKLEEVSAQPELRCQEHDERLKLYCSDDQKLICVVCVTSRNHQGHHTGPVGEIAEHYKGILRKEIDLLNEQLQEICRSLDEEETDVNNLKKQSVKLQQNITSKFEQLHEFLHQEEKSLKTKLEQKANTILEQKKENLKRISEQHSSFKRAVSDMQGKLSLEDAEFLQDLKSTLGRCSDLQFKKPQRVSVDLCQGDFSGPIQYSMWKRMLKVINPVPFALKLNPNTAHPKLVLSSDQTAMRLGDKQKVPDKAERFTNWHSVLAQQSFTTGRHYWELEVGKNSMWSVGVVKESVPRKKEFSPEPKAGVWALWRLGEEYTTMISPRTALPVKVKPSRLGVYLDYEAGQLSLYNADDMSHLYTFKDKFTEKLYPFFLTGCNIDPLQIFNLNI
ncbi:nuclear factor 7, brain-like [Mobula hypostoma]|uniref:nuclear factor 7, brain-like n=1 Tax=Mobula hypostoma TaxID=723540 RepID=UPI002FC283C1